MVSVFSYRMCISASRPSKLRPVLSASTVGVYLRWMVVLSAGLLLSGFFSGLRRAATSKGEGSSSTGLSADDAISKNSSNGIRSYSFSSLRCRSSSGSRTRVASSFSSRAAALRDSPTFKSASPAGYIRARLMRFTLRCVITSKSRRESTSSSKNSTRTALGRPMGNTSRMPPRSAHCPRASTSSTRS